MKKCKCGLRLFNNQAEAEAAGIAFYAHLNFNINGQCPGCAGINNIDYLTQLEIETAVNGGRIPKKTGDKPMPETTTQALINAYHTEYIGQSAGLAAVAESHRISPSKLKEAWLRADLRLRDRKQAYAARRMDGAPWQWPEEPQSKNRPAAAKPPAPQPDPEPEPVEIEPDPEPQPEEQQPPAANRSLILHTEDYIPTPLHNRPAWLPGTNTNGYHSPALADLAHLVRDLRAAGADVEINLNIALEVRQK